MPVSEEMVERAKLAVREAMVSWGERFPTMGYVEAVARAALTAALSDQVVVPEIIDNNNTNPLIVISPDQVAAWLRAVADAAGYSDRGSCAIQVKIAHKLGDTICLGSPELVLMVSNIMGSRTAPPQPTEDNEADTNGGER